MLRQYEKLITSVIIILLAVNLYSQEDFAPNKHLEKAIKKIWGYTEPGYKELAIGSGATINPNGKIYLVEKSEGSQVGYAYIGRVYSCRSGGCSAAPSEKSADNYEYFDYIILYTLSAEIELVKVFNYQATHGHEICSAGWLKQFKGYNGSNDLGYGNEIDAISGATISAISIIVDIENVSTQVGTILANKICCN